MLDHFRKSTASWLADNVALLVPQRSNYFNNYNQTSEEKVQ